METCSVTKIIPLSDQQAEWQYRIRMIREAQQFLYASTYFIQYDRYGREYIEGLLDARGKGVFVTLLIDTFGQMLSGALMNREEKTGLKIAIAALIKAGVNVWFYRCRSPLKKLLGSGMHIKIQLSDSGGALFTSGNISATSYDKWREFAVYVEGSFVCSLLNQFADLGVSVDSAHIRHLQAYCRDDKPAQSIGYLSYNPVCDPHFLNPLLLKYPNPITDYLIEIFSSAQKRISLTSLYFKPVPSLVRALIHAARRGVSVEIFHSDRDVLGSNVPWIPGFYLYRQLCDANITIYENRRGEHSKLILIDGKTTLFGSYNLEYAAHDRMAEAMMVSKDTAMLGAIENIFSQLRASADNVKINSQAFEALPATLKWQAAMAKPFLRWL